MAEIDADADQKKATIGSLFLPNQAWHYMRSYTAAMPCPPPMHMVTSA